MPVKKLKLPSQDVLRALLRYEPATGKLYWLERVPAVFENSIKQSAEHSCARWNAQWAGKEAFTFVDGQYCVGTLLGKRYKAHRIIWKWMTGEEPDEIDHDDGDGINNRWRNLKDGSHGDNMKNKRRRADNKSGVIGVYWFKNYNKWTTDICVNGRTKHLGYFDRLEDAVVARKAAEQKHGYHPNHGRSG